MEFLRTRVGSGGSSARASISPSIYKGIEQASRAECRAYLLGASRDGTFNRLHGTTRIAQSDTRWLTLIQLLLTKLGSRSWIYREGKRDVWVVETKWRDGGPTEISAMAEKTAFVRGYFDAEGGVPRDQARRFYIQITQKSWSDLIMVRDFLEDIGISCGRVHNPSFRVDPSYWRFFVLTRFHVDFAMKVSSWHPRKRLILDARFPVQWIG